MKRIKERIEKEFKKDEYISIIYEEKENKINFIINERYYKRDLYIYFHNELIEISERYFDDEELKEKEDILFSINSLLYELDNNKIIDIIIFFLNQYINIIE